MFKKKILIYIFTILFLSINIKNGYAVPAILSETSILMDANSSSVLFNKDMNKKMFPASLTKIMTAIVAIENGNLTDILTVDDTTPYEIDGSHISLEPGEQLSLKDLLYALMLPSANDAALTIAKHFGGVDNFVNIMNQKAKAIGALNTNFVNPHGLHDKNHYSTAYDLALITRYAMNNDTFKTIAKTTKYEIAPTNKKSETRYFVNLNKLIHNTSSNEILVDGYYISPVYEYATGVKTGYTPEAGNCLVATSTKDNTSLIMVSMKGISLNMYRDAHNLFNYGFEEFKSKDLITKNTFITTVPIKNGDIKEIPAITQNTLVTLVENNSKGNISYNVLLNDIKLPLKKDDVIGKLEFVLDNKSIGTVNLITPVAVKNNLFKNIFMMFLTTIGYIVFIFAIVVLFMKLFRKKIIIKRKRKKSYN